MNNSWTFTEKSLSYGDHPNRSVTLKFLSEETTMVKLHSLSLPHFSRRYMSGRGDRGLEAPSAALLGYAHNLVEIAGLMALDGF